LAGDRVNSEGIDMDTPLSPVIEVIKGVAESFSGKSMTLKSDRVSSRVHKCAKGLCKWQTKREDWLINRRKNWPFRSWFAAEVWVQIVFEYDGCDVHNARLVPSSKSYSRWYNDKSTFDIVAEGALSKIADTTGCRDCCEEAAVVEFDVTLNIMCDYIRTDQQYFQVTLSGNGSVKKQAF
jgi:hypothetical protein